MASSTNPGVDQAAQPPPAVSLQPAAPQPAGSRGWKWLRRLVLAILLIGAVALTLPILWNWVDYRRTHSITDDAFVEAHIVNIAPQMVSGRIVRFLAEEDDRVEPGQVL